MVKKGFTLIELLIVITIIGILAVAVLSSINPIEQIRRSQDTGLRSDSAELLSAFERYYTAFFEYPWTALGQGNPSQTAVDPGGLSWIDELIAKGGVKPQFKDRDSWEFIFATQTGTVVSLCFDPTSTTFQEEADDKGKYRSGLSGCASGCFICVPE